jgi:hypothetical protein
MRSELEVCGKNYVKFNFVRGYLFNCNAWLVCSRRLFEAYKDGSGGVPLSPSTTDVLRRQSNSRLWRPMALATASPMKAP